jgi:hypothetical protein
MVHHVWNKLIKTYHQSQTFYLVSDHIKHFLECEEELITLVPDPTLLATEPTPRVRSMPSYVVATPVTCTLNIVLARYRSRHQRHDNRHLRP